jgi:hypothetical protein
MSDWIVGDGEMSRQIAYDHQIAELDPQPVGRNGGLADRQPRLLDEAEAAGILNCSRAFLRRCRLFRSGPQFLKLGRLVRYRQQDLEAYIEAGMQAMAA